MKLGSIPTTFCMGTLRLKELIHGENLESNGNTEAKAQSAATKEEIR